MTKLKDKVPKKDVSWLDNFRRWSTQICTGMAALSAIQFLPELISALTGAAPLWRSFLPPWVYAALMTVLPVLGVIARNLKQRNVT